MQRTQNLFRLVLTVRLQWDWKMRCERLWCTITIKPWQHEASVQLAATSTAVLMESQLAINPEQAEELPPMLGKKNSYEGSSTAIHHVLYSELTISMEEFLVSVPLRSPLPPWLRINNQKFLNYVLVWILTDFCKPEQGVLAHHRMVSMLDSLPAWKDR